ncbi:hypothetical protein L13192_05732 [Pyrenophora tritici-repentis]|nr:hypothetical protein L13192_05732 [Pyrenophora tritici-repentis]
MGDKPRRSVSGLINWEKRKAEYRHIDQHIEQGQKRNEEEHIKWIQQTEEEKTKRVQAERACSLAGIPTFYVKIVEEMNRTIDDILYEHGINVTKVEVLMECLEHMEQYDEVQKGMEAFQASKNAHGTEGQHQIPVPRMTSQELKMRLARGPGQPPRPGGAWGYMS